MYTGYNVFILFDRDWDGQRYTARHPVMVEHWGNLRNLFVGGPGMQPATFQARQIGPAIEAARKLCSGIAKFEVVPDGEYEHNVNPPAEGSGSALSGCPGDVGARDSY